MALWNADENPDGVPYPTEMATDMIGRRWFLSRSRASRILSLIRYSWSG